MMHLDQPPPRRFATKPWDNDGERKRWNEWRNGRYGDPADDPVLAELQRRILGFGGRAVLFRSAATSVERGLLKSGIVWDGAGAKRLKGKQNDCHRNSAMIYERRWPKWQIANGYALNEGLWREHSWLVNASDGSIGETTVERVAYAGMLLDTAEAATFWYLNRDRPLPDPLPGFLAENAPLLAQIRAEREPSG